MESIGTQERATLTLLRETAAWTGKEFAAELVSRLCRRFGAVLVVAGRLEGDDERWIRPAAVSHLGRPIPPTPYRLRGAPCELVVERGPMQVRDGVAEQFPDDEMLRELHAVCYVGQPIRSPNGDTIGVLAALFDHSRDLDVDEAAVLEICAARLGAEFEREDAQRELHRAIETESLERIAGEIARDFNNQLTAMRSNLEHLGDAAQGEQAEILAELQLATASMIEQTAVLLERHDATARSRQPARAPQEGVLTQAVLARSGIRSAGTAASLPATAAAPPTPHELRPKHVLLADGDDLVRRACHRSLRPLGAELLEAHCADRLFELLDAVPTTEPLAVLLDAHLPGCGLADLLQDLRRRRPDAQVLLMTGLGRLGTDAAATERRIAKPFSAVTLRVEVGQALEAARTSQAEPATMLADDLSA